MTSKSYNMNHDDGTVCAPGTGTESGCMMNLGKATVIRQPNAALGKMKTGKGNCSVTDD